MKKRIFISKIVCYFGCLLSVTIANATVVEVRTNFGNFQVNLFDNTTPRTVENFLSYVNAGAYANNTVHRSVPGFIIQMGGFQYASSFPPDPIATGTAVINEPELSNVRGTLAMAKLSNNPNSATSQFFVNLSDNAGGSASLDTQNAGFTVFGQVLGNGMQIVDQIAALPRFQFPGPFTDIPLMGYTSADRANNVSPTIDNLVIITDIVVIDSAVSTNPSLNPIRNTLINSSGGLQPSPSGSSSGGGSLSFLLLMYLGLITSIRQVSVKTP